MYKQKDPTPSSSNITYSPSDGKILSQRTVNHFLFMCFYFEILLSLIYSGSLKFVLHNTCIFLCKLSLNDKLSFFEVF